MLRDMVIMNAFTRESRKKSPALGYLVLCVYIMSGCAYRLTNLHTASPNNIKTIHVEAVYDTSSEAVPHEHLWTEIQKSIAANGQLRLASASEADALLRAHIVKAQTAKGGERKVLTTNKKRKEPDIFAGQTPPPTRGQLRDISVADDYFVKSTWTSTVRVEVWDLNTRKILLQREYPLSGEVLAARGDVPTQIHHIRHEESFDHSFENASRGVAERIVSDLLVR